MENQLAPHARLWVFTSNKLLSSEQCSFIESELKQFLEGWNNHGKAMAGQAWIEMNRILVVAADENIMLASGCSIDKLNREVLRIGDALGVNLFDRLTVLFQENNEIQTWGKGIANGFSFCALTGKKEIMEYGGIRRKGQPKVFLVSTTHGGETHGIAAALATIDVFENNPVIQHNHAIGDYFMNGVKGILSRRKLEDYFAFTGFNWCVGLVVKNQKKEPCLFYRTLFMQEMIQRGVLYQGILSPCFSHTQDDIDFMLAATTLYVEGIFTTLPPPLSAMWQPII